MSNITYRCYRCGREFEQGMGYLDTYCSVRCHQISEDKNQGNNNSSDGGCCLFTIIKAGIFIFIVYIIIKMIK